MEIKQSDMPQWAQSEIARTLGDKKRPRCEVEYVDKLVLGGVWHDACKRYVTAKLGNEIRRAQSAYYDSLLNASASEQAMYFGGETAFHPDMQVLVIQTYPESARLYLHTSKAPKALESPTPDLSEFEQAVLGALVCLTSAGRKDNWARYRVPMALVNAAYQKLASLGFATINKAGSVAATIEGRNLVNKLRDSKGFQWYDGYWYHYNDKK